MGSSTPTYMAALFSEGEKHSDYTRLPADPGGENQIIMFKSCFPNSALAGNPSDPPSSQGWLTVGHAKYVYNRILQYFRTQPNKLFIVITAPPLSDPTYAANARAFNQWLVNNWLSENSYALKNVAVFDFYNVLTHANAHHWYHNGQVEHSITSQNTLYYPSGDDHPSAAGSLKATDEYVELLNVFYHRWMATDTVSSPNLLAPSGSLHDAHPVYQWSAVANATAYRIAVFSVKGAAYVIQSDVDSSACSEGVCRYHPSVMLAAGDYEFKVMASSSSSESEYSSPMEFAVTQQVRHRRRR